MTCHNVVPSRLSQAQYGEGRWSPSVRLTYRWEAPIPIPADHHVSLEIYTRPGWTYTSSWFGSGQTVRRFARILFWLWWSRRQKNRTWHYHWIPLKISYWKRRVGGVEYFRISTWLRMTFCSPIASCSSRSGEPRTHCSLPCTLLWVDARMGGCSPDRLGFELK